MPEAQRADLLRGLAVFAEAPEASHAAIAEALGLPRVPDASEYSDVFLFQLYPYASVHLGNEGMMGGEARDRVAGFWRAVGIAPPTEPDHLAALIGLYASLCEQEAGIGSAGERLLVTRARGALLDEHLAPWIFLFLARIRELAPSSYGPWAELLDGALREEVGAVGATDGERSAHVRAARPLEDPRAEGSGAFLEALLAPVRLGALITRADLAAIAGEIDLGLRAGERRYALEHLLAQDAEAVLRALAREVRRQAGMRAATSEQLGGTSTVAGRTEAWLGERAFASADLLESLATESVELVSQGAAP